ncbi:MAG: phage/plasmid primase, P4 family [Patescibacteria group bacterium]
MTKTRAVCERCGKVYDAIGLAALGADRMRATAAAELGAPVSQPISIPVPAKGRPAPTPPETGEAWCTDVGNAERFAAQHRHRARYCAEFGWMLYDGQRWKRDALGAQALAVETAKGIVQEAARSPKERRDSLLRWASSSQGIGHVRAMLDLARSALSCSWTDFDADPLLLNCANGTVDLRTGELMPHRAEDLQAKLCPVEYRPDAAAGRWASFLSEVMPDEELRPWVLRGLGYSITGCVGEQCFFMTIGDGADGKSTLLNAVARVLGDYAATIAFEAILLASHTGGCDIGLEAVRGARLVICGEPKQDRPLDEATIKRLTGGDTIQINPKHRDPYSFTMTAKLWAMANTAPPILGQDHGTWRRVRRVPFTQRFAINPAVQDELWEARVEILASLVRAAVEWHEKGLGVCSVVEAETGEYRDDCDPVGRFLADCCELGDGYVSRAGELRQAFEDWAAENGQEELSERVFWRRLSDKRLPPARTKTARLRKGVRLLSSPPDGWSSPYSD